MFHLQELPKSMLIVGGGYIACEFACILHGLGVEVTQYYRGAQILRGFDEEARGLIADAMKERGIDLHTGTNIVEMHRADSPEAQGMEAAPVEASQFGPAHEDAPGRGRSGSRPQTATSAISTRCSLPRAACPTPPTWGWRNWVSR